MERVREAGVTLAVSIVTWGEIVYGHRRESEVLTPRQQEYLRFIEELNPLTLFINSRGLAETYGELRARLFTMFGPKGRKKGKWPEDCWDGSKVLGIQENDLWIAAQAKHYNLILATTDKMRRIRNIVTTDELEIQDWRVPPC